jgi:acetyl esterase/lipase
MFMALSQPIIALYQPEISIILLDRIQILDIKPQNGTDNGKVLVYAHGGGYTFGSDIVDCKQIRLHMSMDANSVYKPKKYC